MQDKPATEFYEFFKIRFWVALGPVVAAVAPGLENPGAAFERLSHFPLQGAYLGLVLLLIAFVLRQRRGTGWIFSSIVASLIGNFVWLYPVLPTRDIAPTAAEGLRVKIVQMNVLTINRHFAAVTA
jgi:endonuclease/exonuclease/phosphatase (EEP) superfamily protein YafD